MHYIVSLILGLALIGWTGDAHAGCQVLTPDTTSRLALKRPQTNACTWDTPMQDTINILDANACFQNKACTLSSGGSYDGGSGDTTKPCKRGTALPGTCGEGECFQDTDSGGSETYLCTATDTWSKIGLDTSSATVSLLAPGGGLQNNSQIFFSVVGADTMKCLRFVAPYTVYNATKIAVGIITTGANCGAALYNSSGSTRIATTGALSCTPAGPLSSGTLSAFDVLAGTAYLACICASTASGSFAGVGAVTAGHSSDLLNAYVANVGDAAINCSSGAPATTTGTLTATDTEQGPLMLISQ